MLYRKISSEIETHLTSGNDKILIIEAPDKLANHT